MNSLEISKLFKEYNYQMGELRQAVKHNHDRLKWYCKTRLISILEELLELEEIDEDDYNSELKYINDIADGYEGEY